MSEKNNNNIEEILNGVQKEAFEFAGNIEKKLNASSNSAELADFLMKYNCFNRGFSGGALVLAGKTSLAINALGYEDAERAGGYILSGVIDEYMERESWNIKTHCTLRRSLTKSAISFLFPKINFERTMQLQYGQYLETIMSDSARGYCIVDGDFGERSILEGVGFFLASETSGSSEFTALHSYLQKNQPDLVAELKKQTAEGRILYQWVEDHTTLEVDHAESARSAARQIVATLPIEKQNWAIKELKEGSEYFFEFAKRVLLESEFFFVEPT